MSEIANSDGASETEKPVPNEVKFPPFPEPTDEDFDDDIPQEERDYYKEKYKDLNDIKYQRLHCTACDRHMGCSPRNDRIRTHPMLRTLVCHACHAFYNSGEFEKGDDGSELYCRWCGQGGQVYCCSDCPHVFCAKCIKRNLGAPKIKEIENADDWKCFKCNSKCLRDLRSVCWAVLRYCDLKNKMTQLTENPDLKEAYEKECALDLSECCKTKTTRRNQKLTDSIKKKDIKKESDTKVAANIVSKIPPTIQVKKFASVTLGDSGSSPPSSNKPEKKPHKRSADTKIMVKNPISIASNAKLPNQQICMPPLAKKVKIPAVNTPVRYPNILGHKPLTTYTRIRPKTMPQLPIPIANNCYNGFTSNLSNFINDNINLSLESLTQGLDMSAVAALTQNTGLNDDVVCTPDFPLEPMCEVTEDNDDDVQCITPSPVIGHKVTNPPPLIQRGTNHVPNITDVSSENIVQMTDNDVTVNESTGGLKFRVDPQTLSSNKMYRLPDGRIFAINANPNMPGGYSATIVAVTETGKSVPKGATFAAKLSSVSATSTPAPKSRTNNSSIQVARFNSKRSTPKNSKASKAIDMSSRECDLNVPVEWYRYNLIDAVDALEYSLSRLQKLKKEATSVYLRTRSVNEMRSLHRTLERLLSTSSTRFNEIRCNLNKGLKQYIMKKMSGNTSDEDDDVEILPNVEEDPIFIDENSMESNVNGSENQEVDLTGPGSSEYNDSGENRIENSRIDLDPLNISENDNVNVLEPAIVNIRGNVTSEEENKKETNDSADKINGLQRAREKDSESFEELNGELTENGATKSNVVDKEVSESNIMNDKADCQTSDRKMNVSEDIKLESDDKMKISDDKLKEDDDILEGDELDNSGDKNEDSVGKILDDVKQRHGKTTQNTNELKKLVNSSNKIDTDDKIQDSEMSEEMIETLLKDDNSRDNTSSSLEAPEALQVP